MNKSKKPLIIVSLCLIAAGLLICTGVMAVLGFDFTKLDNSVFTENIYEFSQNISNIVIEADTADIQILLSKENKVKLICYEDENGKHTASLRNGTLTVSNNHKEWYEYISYIGFNFHSPKITLYLPEKVYNSISIECSTGNIEITNTDVTNIDIETSTGDITLDNVNTAHIEFETSTGSIELNQTYCEGLMELETSTGDIIFYNSDAQTITAETSTGDITGTLLSGKDFYTDTSTGDIDVPDTTGGRCELDTSTGDIEIIIAK